MLSFCRELLLLHSSCAEVRLNPTLESHSESIMKTFPYSNATYVVVMIHVLALHYALMVSIFKFIQCMKTFSFL